MDQQVEAQPDFRALFEAAPGLFLVLSPELKIVAVSQAYNDATLTKREAIVGRHLFEVFPDNPDDPTADGVRNLRASLERVLATKRADTMAVQKYDIRTPDGSFEERHWAPDNSPVFGPDGEIRYIIHRVENVTEVVLLKRQGVEDQRQRQVQKMEAVGHLTGGIAHDFNNILTVITGLTEILGEGLKDDPQMTSLVGMIDTAASRGAEVTKHLLAFSRQQPLQPHKTDLNALVSDTAKLLRPALGEQVEIELSLAKDAAPALIDANHLATALLNLAVNARDAMPQGGKLVIETRNVQLDEAYAADNVDVKPGPYVMVAVTDNGAGIPAAIRDKVFEPFFTTKATGKGTGLGLSMVYGFVKQSNGHVKIYSEEGHGTSIKLYLPPAPEEATLAVPQPAAQSGGGNERILVAEDDPLVRKYVSTQLAHLGYRTMVAGSGREAMSLIDNGFEPDLLLTDVIMSGGMNGKQLADLVVKRRPATRVLFMSGYTEDAIVHQGRLDPGVHLLPKPFRRADLARMIRTALSK
jgi:signal transduction histidine kinase/CheY-like chemotaxis protein